MRVSADDDEWLPSIRRETSTNLQLVDSLWRPRPERWRSTGRGALFNDVQFLRGIRRHDGYESHPDAASADAAVAETAASLSNPFYRAWFTGRPTRSAGQNYSCAEESHHTWEMPGVSFSKLHAKWLSINTRLQLNSMSTELSATRQIIKALRIMSERISKHELVTNTWRVRNCP